MYSFAAAFCSEMMRVSYSLPNSFSEKQWATQRLKDYLVKGYAVNQKRLEQLHQTIQLISEGGKIEDLQLNEAKELLEIISEKAPCKFFRLLNGFRKYHKKVYGAPPLNEVVDGAIFRNSEIFGSIRKNMKLETTLHPADSSW